MSDLLDDGLCTVREAAQFLALGRTMVYEMIEAGELPHVPFGRGKRIPRKAVRALAEARLKNAKAESVAATV